MQESDGDSNQRGASGLNRITANAAREIQTPAHYPCPIAVKLHIERCRTLSKGRNLPYRPLGEFNSHPREWSKEAR